MAAAKKPQPAASGPLPAGELEALRRDLEKELGAPMAWGSDEGYEVRLLPLGIAPFDAVLDGGFAYGRFSLLYGLESCGKTLLSMVAMRQAQARGESCVFIDVERTWTPAWASTLGLDAEQILVVRPRSGEEVWRTALAMVKRKVGVLVIDSIAAICPSVNFNADADEIFEKTKVGADAQLNKAGLRAMMQENTETCVILINQVSMAIGGYGNPETMTGGQFQKHAAWHRVRIRRGPWIEEGTGDAKRKVGYQMRIVVEKNKQGVPFEQAEVPFMFDTAAFDEVAILIDQGVATGILVAPHYQLGEERWYGRAKFSDALHARPELVDALRAELAKVEVSEF